MIEMILRVSDSDKITLAEMQAVCERMDCKAFKTSDKVEFRIETENAINFFWLGMNFINAINKLRES